MAETRFASALKTPIGMFVVVSESVGKTANEEIVMANFAEFVDELVDWRSLPTGSGQLISAFESYFSGINFESVNSLPLRLPPRKPAAIWEQLRKIKAGTVTTYKQLGHMVYSGGDSASCNAVIAATPCSTLVARTKYDEMQSQDLDAEASKVDEAGTVVGTRVDTTVGGSRGVVTTSTATRASSLQVEAAAIGSISGEEHPSKLGSTVADVGGVFLKSDAEVLEQQKQPPAISLNKPAVYVEDRVLLGAGTIPRTTKNYLPSPRCSSRTKRRKVPQGSKKQLHHPFWSRAIGAAMSSNTILIALPCHRVIGSNGNLTGFGAGLERKQWLLLHENCCGPWRPLAPIIPTRDLAAADSRSASSLDIQRPRQRRRPVSCS